MTPHEQALIEVEHTIATLKRMPFDHGIGRAVQCLEGAVFWLRLEIQNDTKEPA